MAARSASSSCVQPSPARSDLIRSANCLKTWVSDTGNLYLSETAACFLYDPSYNRVRRSPCRDRGPIMSAILKTLRRLFTSAALRSPRTVDVPVASAGVPHQHVESAPAATVPSHYKTPFVRSFEPTKIETPLRSRSIYQHGYGGLHLQAGTLQFNNAFRSQVEVGWAKAFDALGLSWEYEPMKFDMGPEHFSYTPDFRVEGLSIAGSDHPLYIEVKWFGEDMYLTKYARFTEWYNCDLLVLAHDEGGVLRPRKGQYFLILKCPDCSTYDWFPCDGTPTNDYIRSQNAPSAPYIQRQNVPYALARRFPFGY